jgi:phospholipase C
VVAPEAYTEHPNWPANYGAWYVSQILDALTDHPEVWSKTAFFTTYDENDGFFDHIVPPTVPPTRTQGLSNVDITNEIFPGSSEYAAGPYGMGIRVPMIVVSPWSKGGGSIHRSSTTVRSSGLSNGGLAASTQASWKAILQSGAGRSLAT